MMYQLEQDESGRIELLRILICVFVLFIHAYTPGLQFSVNSLSHYVYELTHFIGMIICDCAVPVFILISSVLLYRKPVCWFDNIKGKMRTLAAPYLIFNTLWIGFQMTKFYILKIGTPDENNAYFHYSTFQWLDAYLGFADDFKPVYTLLWYVRDLFILNVLSVLLKRIVDRFPLLIFVATVLFWLSDIPNFIVQRYSLCFFIFGYYIVKYDLHMSVVDRMKGMDLFLLYLFLAAIDLLYADSYRIIHKVFIVVSALNFIYLSHRFVYNVITSFTPGSAIISLILFFIKPVIALLFCTGTFYLMSKYMPSVTRVIMGRRSGAK